MNKPIDVGTTTAYAYDPQWKLKNDLLIALRDSIDFAISAMDVADEAAKKTNAFYFNMDYDVHLREAAKHLRAAAKSVERDVPRELRADNPEYDMFARQLNAFRKVAQRLALGDLPISGFNAGVFWSDMMRLDSELSRAQGTLEYISEQASKGASKGATE